MRIKQETSLFVVLSALGLLAACGDDDPDVGSVRVVHAAPDAPAVDVYAGDVVLVTNLAYGQASPFVEVFENAYNLVVRVAGTDTIVYESGLIEVSEDDAITAVATGNVTSSAPDDSFRILALYEDFDSADDDEARVRIVHASPDAPTVDLDVGDDGSVDIPGLARFDETGEDGVPLPADAALQLGIVAGGARVTAFTTPELPPSSELFVIAIGNVAALPRAADGFSLLVVGPAGVVTQIRQNPTVYALHASPDAPAVDIRADVAGPNVYAALSFGELGLAQVPPGDYTLSFFAAGDPGSTPVTTAAITGLAAGERYLAVAAGMLTPVSGEQPFELLAYPDQFVVDANPRLRVIHVSPDAGAVDISTVSGTALTSPSQVRDLQFEEATEPAGLAVPATPSLAIGVAPTGTTTALATFNLNTTGSKRAFVLAAGALTPEPGEQSFRLFDVNTAVWPWTITTILPN